MSPERLFGALAFRRPWRSYPARILADLEAHLGDRKLHVVAAPGAGKTVLGLEIIRRLGLRCRWWHTLTGLSGRHDGVTLSLTATPPYDAVAREWRSYDALCGPIDAEIPAPVLVQSRDLCPHRDLVFAAVTRHAAAYVRNREDEAGSLELLRNDPALLAMIEALPWIADCRTHAAEILDEPDLFSAMPVYLHDAGRPLLPYARRLLQIREGRYPAAILGLAPDPLRRAEDAPSRPDPAEPHPHGGAPQ
ncbi:hypothetical protein [Rhodovulum sp. YEN HP10]|uniref:hypothetical protein n=1 Tax=Rhodovulum sp. HP10 TaxID=3387397 RepID=UPI0039E1AB9B